MPEALQSDGGGTNADKTLVPIPRFRLTCLVLVFLSTSIGSVIAQDAERISLRFRPAPDRTVHGRSVFELDLDISSELPGSAEPVIRKLTLSLETAYSIVSKAPDDQGRIEIEATIDESTATGTMNGAPIDQPASARSLNGHKAIVTLNADGTIADVKADLAEYSNLIKEFMAAFASRPLTIAVGETVTLPVSINLPFPIPGAGGVPMTSESKMTLVSIGDENGRRIGHFKTSITSDMNQRISGTPGAEMDMEMHMTSTGDADIDIALGIGTKSQQKGTIEMTIRTAGNADDKPIVRLQGTVQTTNEAKY